MTSLCGQQSTVHGPRPTFLIFKNLFFLSLVKKRIIALIGRGGKDVIPPRFAAADRDRLFKRGLGASPVELRGDFSN